MQCWPWRLKRRANTTNTAQHKTWRRFDIEYTTERALLLTESIYEYVAYASVLWCLRCTKMPALKLCRNSNSESIPFFSSTCQTNTENGSNNNNQNWSHNIFHLPNTDYKPTKRFIKKKISLGTQRKCISYPSLSLFLVSTFNSKLHFWNEKKEKKNINEIRGMLGMFTIRKYNKINNPLCHHCHHVNIKTTINHSFVPP